MKKNFRSNKYRLKKRTKQIIIALFFIALGLITIILMTMIIFRKPDTDVKQGSNTSTSSNHELTKKDKHTITLLATGDWIAHDAINQEAKKGETYNYTAMTSDFKSIFADSDINFCNQATMAGGEKYGISGYPNFNAPFEWSKGMVELGCNVINTGTNHTNDMGQDIITSNLDNLDTYKSIKAVAGANRNEEEQGRIKYFEEKGLKFAFLSYSTYSNKPNQYPYSLNRFDDNLVKTQMSEAKQNADIVIVSMRWGTEYSNDINTTQINEAQKLAELGADIILGHGTHTLQPVDIIESSGNKTYVWYGLGNFLNAQLDVGGLTGCLAKMTIDVESKSVKTNQCLAFYQHYEWSAKDRAEENLMARNKFRIMPLSGATEYLAKSQLNTIVQEQLERIKKQVNSKTNIEIVNQ